MTSVGAHNRSAANSGHLQKRNSDSIEEDHALVENKTLARTMPNDSSTDTITSNSYAMYTYRPRIPSNSSQATLTTSIGKVSVSEGNNNCKAETSLNKTDENKARDAIVASNGHCRSQSTEIVCITDCIPNKWGATVRSLDEEGSKCKVDNVSSNRIASIASKCSLFKNTPRVRTIGVLAKKLRGFPLPGSTRTSFAPQHSIEPVGGTSEEVPSRRPLSNPKLSSHISIDSGKSTISNSSLQDLDETEFVGAELAHYMGELNQQRMVR